jgi:hypothetical protein
VEHVTLVEGQDHALDRDPGLGVGRENRRLDRRSPAVSGQEGSVDVQRSLWGQVEQIPAEDLAVAGDQEDVRFLLSQAVHESRILGRLGLDHLQAGAPGSLDERGGAYDAAPSGSTIGRRDDAENRVPAREELRQDGRGEGRGSEKDEAHLNDDRCGIP